MVRRSSPIRIGQLLTALGAAVLLAFAGGLVIASLRAPGWSAYVFGVSLCALAVRQGLSKPPRRTWRPDLYVLAERGRRAERERGPAAVRLRAIMLRRMLALADAVAIGSALLLVRAVAPDSLHVGWAGAVGLPVGLLVVNLFGLYDRDRALIHKSTLDETPKLFQVATLLAVLGWIVYGLAVLGSLMSGALLLWPALFVFLVLTRSCARAVVLRVVPAERCLMIGDEQSAAMILSRLETRWGINAQVVAHLDPDRIVPWIGHTSTRLEEIKELAETLDIHRAIVAPRVQEQVVVNLARSLDIVGVPVSILPRPWDALGISAQLDDLASVTLLGAKSFELSRVASGYKRAFDLVSAWVLMVLSAPFLLTIATLIRAEHGGPTFSRETRIGRSGRLYTRLRFRTLIIDSENGASHPLGDPPTDADDEPQPAVRLTRVGSWLGRLALDKLPELWNVIRGEMTLVGPIARAINDAGLGDDWNTRRLNLTPGMTGPWQRLSTEEVPAEEIVAIDYLYVANWSLWSDAKILMRAIANVLGRKRIPPYDNGGGRGRRRAKSSRAIIRIIVSPEGRLIPSS